MFLSKGMTRTRGRWALEGLRGCSHRPGWAQLGNEGKSGPETEDDPLS